MSETATPLRIAMICCYLPGASKMGAGHQVRGLANALTACDRTATAYSACETPVGAKFRTEASMTMRRRSRCAASVCHMSLVSQFSSCAGAT